MCLLSIDSNHAERVWELEELPFVEPVCCDNCTIWSGVTMYLNEPVGSPPVMRIFLVLEAGTGSAGSAFVTEQ